MSTIRQQQAARRNGAKSQGPVTPAGKAASSLNSIRHGLAGSTLVLTSEEQGRFQQFLQDHINRFQPADAVELNLVEEMCAAAWRQRRCWAIETALLDLEMLQQEERIADDFEAIDETARLALAFKGLADNSNSLALLGRYESRFRRQYEQACRQLRSLQQQGRDAQPPAPRRPATAACPRPPLVLQPPTPPLPNEPGAAQLPVLPIACPEPLRADTPEP